jgi:N-acyl-D-glucosamine 2-epimerase
MKNHSFIFFLLTTLVAFAQNNKEERVQIANTMENSILHEMLNKWYPQNMDTLYGGFLSEFTYDFKPTSNQDKFIVTQARHTWSTSKAAMRYPGVTYYKTLAQNGYNFCTM